MTDTAPTSDDQQRVPQRGIVCPDCGLKMLVTTTRGAALGLKVRFVFCPRCEATGTTVERLVRFRRRDGK